LDAKYSSDLTVGDDLVRGTAIRGMLSP
jgi:hypothetical protein